jgi:hypothetical protein
VLAEMRREDVGYLIGTPKGKLSKLEASLLDKPWEQARQDVRVKLLKEDNDEIYSYVVSVDRIRKERSM